ncbi:hypothetical protein, partial [Enterobacter cloacae]|uniref:hypothetical protein n=1 Tax=Enterobacter cloacae TaxID=550 RepID=UPI001C8C9429
KSGFSLKIRQKLYFIVISGMATRYNRASEDDVHGQEMFKAMIQSPNHQGNNILGGADKSNGELQSYIIGANKLPCERSVRQFAITANRK